jgi:hypothetical protein
MHSGKFTSLHQAVAFFFHCGAFQWLKISIPHGFSVICIALQRASTLFVTRNKFEEATEGAWYSTIQVETKGKQCR